MGCGASTKYAPQQEKPPSESPAPTPTPPPPDPGSQKSGNKADHDAEKQAQIEQGSEFEEALRIADEVPVLHNLPKADLPLLVRAMTKKTFKSEEVLIAQGSPNDTLYVVVSGFAEVVHQPEEEDGEKRKEMLLAKLGAGDYFGEQELLHAEAARCTVRVVSGVELVAMTVTHDTFLKLELHKHVRIPKRHQMAHIEDTRRRQSTKTPSGAAKTEDDCKAIAAGIRNNKYLPSHCDLTDEVVQKLTASAESFEFETGAVVISQGDLHMDRFYVVAEGSFEVKGHGHRGTHGFGELSGTWDERVGAGESFGELELLYCIPCAATVTALEPSKVWVISRPDFSQVLGQAFEARIEGYMEALRGVDFLKVLHRHELRTVAEAITEVPVKLGEDVITQGEDATTCFVLLDGEVVMLRDGAEVFRLAACDETKRNCLFGEEELLRPAPRSATVKVVSESAVVLAFDKDIFDAIIKPLDDPLHKHDEDTEDAGKHAPWQLAIERSRKEREVQEVIKRKNLELVSHLGKGGFGSVELVKDTTTEKKYALKRIRRTRLKDDESRKQIFAEKNILSMTCSPYIVRLLRTFRDTECVSFLLEVLSGGDLCTLFFSQDLFGQEPCAQFFVAGMTLGLAHLHERHIMHRDLKPENVMLEDKGWPKLADFGLSKFVVGKTYTAVGTPEYASPEVLSMQGHGLAVDWWALGVILYELMAAHTPFESLDGDVEKMFMRIAKGMKLEKWSWPLSFKHSLKDFISNLLQVKPAKRLPMRYVEGIKHMQEHQWFSNFDWQAFEERRMTVPVNPKRSVNEKCDKEAEAYWTTFMTDCPPANPDDWDVNF
eukprot:gnl/TRDRNA2_/TRDRNA2_135503_c0_seq2.p1 gnl/TRDRNA2_/TRDRNA2_135503_c0~~gnl/TRDRNA2_/TRDRNA2_135503_c0_seq2.p1  ORF type:complete len:830 (-),score=184.55 gnl/TRDRNA2_/TRDRNA2_135503_c0_seq2:16-2505(-)